MRKSVEWSIVVGAMIALGVGAYFFLRYLFTFSTGMHG